VYNYEAYNALK